MLIFAGLSASAFTFFGGSSTVNADHANSIDNGSGTNVWLNGTFNGRFNGAVYFADQTTFLSSGSDGLGNLINQLSWPGGSTFAVCYPFDTNGRQETLVLYPDASTTLIDCVRQENPPFNTINTTELYAPDGYSLCKSNIDLEITNVAGITPFTLAGCTVNTNTASVNCTGITLYVTNANRYSGTVIFSFTGGSFSGGYLFNLNFNSTYPGANVPVLIGQPGNTLAANLGNGNRSGFDSTKTTKTNALFFLSVAPSASITYAYNFLISPP